MTTLRPVSLPDDIEPLWQIAVACDLEIHPESSTTHEEIRSLLEGPTVDLVAGVRVAVGDDGGIEGFVSTDLDAEGREVIVDAYARPGAGADALDALVAHGVSYARAEVAALDDSSEWVCGSGAFADDEAMFAGFATIEGRRVALLGRLASRGRRRHHRHAGQRPRDRHLQRDDLDRHRGRDAQPDRKSVV